MILVSGSKSATRWYMPSISGIESSELGSYICIVSEPISIISVLVIISILDADTGSSYMSEYMTLKSSDGTKYNSGIMILSRLL